MPATLKQIPEHLLARLWEERAARAGSLRAGNGRRFRVIYPGRRGTTAGPDFRDAVLEEEGVGLVRGDVEVHVTGRGWEAHGHGSDPRYNGVVLHVVSGSGDGDARLRSGARAPTLSLDCLLEESSGVQYPAPGPDVWGLLAPQGYSRPSDRDEAADLLDRAGDARFLDRSDELLDLFLEDDPDEVAYTALMEALGYSQNRTAFLGLAHNVPYRSLLKMAVPLPPGQRAGALEECLMVAAGLRSNPRKRCGPPALAWHLFRVRPQNHPARRIAGFVRVLDSFLPPQARGQQYPWAGHGLAEGLAMLVSGVGGKESDHRACCVRLAQALAGGGKGPGPAGIGPQRAGDMAVNCALPFVHALGRERGDLALSRRALSMYGAFPRLQDNELTREMERLLQLPATDHGDKRTRRLVDGARRQQGLIHLQHLLASPSATHRSHPQ